MNSKKALLFIALTAAFAVSSCSGLHDGGCKTNCGGNTTLSITMSDTPPTNSSIVSFALPVIGITLTPSSGSQVSVFSSNPSTDFELTRLQSDTNQVISKMTVAQGTYTAINVTVAAPSATFINSSSSTIGQCVAGAVCGITGSAATITYTFPSGSPLVLNSNANQWVNLDFNYNNAVVLQSSNLIIDVTQTGVMTASTTVPANVPSGNFANLDDFTGQVSAISSSSITVKSTVRGSMTEAISSVTPVYDPQALCAGGGSLSCISVGSVVSLQGLLSSNGVPTATSIDVIDNSTSPVDEVEGVIYPSSCNGTSSYGLILNDSAITTSGSPLASANFGSGVCLTLSSSATFAIDYGILSSQPGLPTGTNAGFGSAGDIFTGQNVRAKVTNATSGTSGINATATVMILRPSRFKATVNTVSGNVVTITNLPAYLAADFPANFIPQVLTYPNATILEGLTSLNSLTNSQTIGLSALFVNPKVSSYPFVAIKVRAF
jgi:hypothetical protein